MGDSGAGRMLYPEDSCPAGTRNASNVVPALFDAGDGSDEGDSKTALGVGSEGYAIVDGKKYPIVRYSLDDIIHRSAAKIRAQIYKERGVLVPEFSLAPQRPVYPPATEAGQRSNE